MRAFQLDKTLMCHKFVVCRVNDMGQITMKQGVNPAVHNLKVEVRDELATVVATVIVNVVNIDDDAVLSSGSLTVPGKFKH